MCECVCVWRGGEVENAEVWKLKYGNGSTETEVWKRKYGNRSTEVRRIAAEQLLSFVTDYQIESYSNARSIFV